MLVRHIGLHRYMDSVATEYAKPRHGPGSAAFRNSRAGSLYVVKSKLHGNVELALMAELFAAGDWRTRRL